MFVWPIRSRYQPGDDRPLRFTLQIDDDRFLGRLARGGELVRLNHQSGAGQMYLIQFEC